MYKMNVHYIPSMNLHVWELRHYPLSICTFLFLLVNVCNAPLLCTCIYIYIYILNSFLNPCLALVSCVLSVYFQEPPNMQSSAGARGRPQLRGGGASRARLGAPHHPLRPAAQNWHGPGESDCLIKTSLQQDQKLNG